MNLFPTSHSSRSALLRARCEAQRQEFGARLADIERRLAHADSAIGSVRRFFSRPGVIAGGLGLLFGLKRVKSLSLVSRGWFALTTVRRLYRMFKG